MLNSSVAREGEGGSREREGRGEKCGLEERKVACMHAYGMKRMHAVTRTSKASPCACQHTHTHTHTCPVHLTKVTDDCLCTLSTLTGFNPLQAEAAELRGLSEGLARKARHLQVAS